MCLTVQQCNATLPDHLASETELDAQVYLINEWLLERDDQTARVTLIAGKRLVMPCIRTVVDVSAIAESALMPVSCLSARPNPLPMLRRVSTVLCWSRHRHRLPVPLLRT